MATRTRVTWKVDNQGQFARQIGRKRTDNGKFVQHKFRLGAELAEAKRREQRLRELWGQIEKEYPKGAAEWTSETLDFARQLAKGENLIELPQLHGESPIAYARRLHRTQKKYPAVAIVGEDREAQEIGEVAIDSAFEVQSLARDTVHQLSVELDSTITATRRRSRKSPKGTGAGLHGAFDAFIEWIKKEYHREPLGRVNDGGSTLIRQVGTLKEKHEDTPLSTIDYAAVDLMFQFWKQRPFRKGTKRPISRVSAENYIGLLKRFFRWLHRQPKFAWSKPANFEDIVTKVEDDPDALQRGLAQVKTFSLDELMELNKAATPLERLFLLLGLNCAFGVKEIATLTVGEVVLFKGHSERDQELLSYRTTAADSFVKRVRRKNCVYGEWILFPQTVQALQWALQRRRSLPDFSQNAPLLLNSNGERYDKPTKGDHRNQQISNRFNDLVARIRAKNASFPKLSFGKLRKTSGNLMRDRGGGEVSAVHLCHGKAVKNDDLADIYTNRPIGKVFATLRLVEQYLQPVFEAAGPNPFAK